MVRIGLFLTLALGLFGFGVVAWISAHPHHTTVAAVPPPPPVKVQVLVAAAPLRAGSLLRPEDIAARTMLRSDMPPGANLDTPVNRGALMGAMMRRSLGKGETLTLADLMRSGDHGFLAAVLGPGMCAVTVGVDAVSGTAGLIWPGDRVDVILTENGGSGATAVSAMRILNNVRVIAIDQQLVQGTAANSSNTAQPLARTVTLEVSADQAERVAVATRLGSLSLAVLSAALGSQAVAGADKTAVVWGTDVSPAQPQEPSPPPAPLTVHIWQGVNDPKAFSY